MTPSPPLVRDLAHARELSIKKWEYIIGNDGNSGGLITKYPELDELWAKCGLCQFMAEQQSTETGFICTDCPLFDNYDSGENCCEEYNRWGNAHLDRWARYWARKLLERIKAVKV